SEAKLNSWLPIQHFQAEFDSLRPFSYPNTDVFLLCFNVMLPSTLRSITDHWIPEITRSSPNTPNCYSIPVLHIHELIVSVILVGTQSDLRSNMRLVVELCRRGEQPVNESKARLLADEFGADYVECSALTQSNLKEVFDAAILAALRGKSAQIPMQRICHKDEKKSKFREGIRRIVTFTKRLI
ncbi:unnamed protein product, partial [Anisakis simplex]|uniref:Ras homolog family member U n=1 Tax=Anisakis simplex TaxID=6269 RepID=A0A0M3K5N2_ANISI